VSPNTSGDAPILRNVTKPRSDVAFFIGLSAFSSIYVFLIVAMLVADVCFTSWSNIIETLLKREVQAAIRLTFLSCTAASILSIWVAIPFGYLLSRYRFPGRSFFEAVADVPFVLPPMVIGLSLLILFHLNIYGWELERWLRDDLGFGVTFRWPAVVLAQFVVACAFAIRTMRVTFDQINPRAEEVARTLGCTRYQSFSRVALPQAMRGIVAAFAVAWARSFGEFGPILVFAGSTRMRTEVLSTTVYLEWSVGNLSSAVAVSLVMVLIASLVLVVIRFAGGPAGR